jgi:predicted O-methyltransferase YrrM
MYWCFQQRTICGRVRAQKVMFLAVLLLTMMMGSGTAAFSAASGGDSSSSARLSFHIVLERVGKTVFRPGGSEATNTLHAWLMENTGQGEDLSVLELATGLGTGGIALAAKSKNNHVWLTDRDESRLEQAQQVANVRGLGDQIHIQSLDMTKIDDEQKLGVRQFDAAIVEASLTHQPDAVKRKILRDLHKRAKQVLLHEICLRGDGLTDESEKAKDVKSKVGRALTIGYHPLTIPGWKEVIEECGFEITHIEYGPLRVLNPKNLLQDEGSMGVARIVWNLATHKDLRDRMRETKAVINEYRDTLGYVIMRAVRKE